MTVLALETVAGGEFGLPLIIFPYLMVFCFSRPCSKGSLLQNIAFVVAIQFQPARLLGYTQAVGQNDQYLSFHHSHLDHTFCSAKSQMIFMGPCSVKVGRKGSLIFCNRIICWGSRAVGF